MRLINICVKEGVHGFSDGLDCLITFMLKNRAFLSGDQLDTANAVEQLIADLMGHLVLSGCATFASSSASLLSSSSPSAPRPRRSQRASKMATASTLSAAPTGVSFLEKKQEAASVYNTTNLMVSKPLSPSIHFAPAGFEMDSPRHFPMACDQRPATRKEMITAIQCAKQKASAAPLSKGQP